ncbi:MAG: mug [Acidimicrobiales bacterium]|nr:mug [Acidimicrobiales bacterium]
MARRPPAERRDRAPIPAVDVPSALAALHGGLPVGEQLRVRLVHGTGTWATSAGLVADRPFTCASTEALVDLLIGGGFSVDEGSPATPVADSTAAVAITATRERSLPNHVGPGMRMLCCGLNPSLRAADAGVGYVTPGNRFWPALLATGLATVDRDPRDLLARHGIGMTDLVKRATPRAAELAVAEYRAGGERLARLCAWLQPGALCVVGLVGWRAAVDRHALVGWQPERLGGVPVYVMPSTSGLNARVSLAALTDHLRAAAEGAPA